MNDLSSSHYTFHSLKAGMWHSSAKHPQRSEWTPACREPSMDVIDQLSLKYLLFIYLAVSSQLQHYACELLHCSHFSLLVAPGVGCPASCGTWIPRQGIKPMSPTLEDRFLTTGTLGKSLGWLFIGILPMERFILVSSFREGKASFYFSNSKTHHKLRIF